MATRHSIHLKALATVALGLFALADPPVVKASNKSEENHCSVCWTLDLGGCPTVQERDALCVSKCFTSGAISTCAYPQVACEAFSEGFRCS